MTACKECWNSWKVWYPLWCQFEEAIKKMKYEVNCKDYKKVKASVPTLPPTNLKFFAVFYCEIFRDMERNSLDEEMEIASL
ncbi:hypothetical protein CUMW_260770 [Citrus unshiu]|uniref:Uncharacterized protein n=1 Tax=Citrus unshiu TaxID=55188 RepID=A0A2H5QTQ6_CITUN|nr:hypothetical protein CUMW_260770 [Citrus unshiu]